ncbi:MAG: type II secretion system GspH family protein [Candidatus Accumulibacter sp.]|jgi:prepilin-type N-terminal cleavage/methylation domain-containing protein|nr:type II secretion system GspH family protein [Accumulibacter sp.]
MRKISGYSSVRGFTLAELTIVLVIVALLIGGLTVPLSAQIDQRDYNETRRQLEEIRESLIGFAVVYGRLPRPAVSFADGRENPNNCSGDSNCTGFIPWSTLGVKKTDAWGKMIRYSVTPAYVADVGFNLESLGKKKVKGVDSYLIGTKEENCSKKYPCSPAVILSHGRNNFGTTPDGAEIANGSTTNADEKTNAEATTNTFIARDPSNASTASGGEFDDIVVWIPPYLLFNRMVAAGRLP